MGLSFSEVVDELCNVISNSDIYKEYIEKLQVVKSDSDLRAKVEEIRQLNFKLQTERNSDNAYDENEALERRFDELSEDKRVYDYIQAESDIVRMYQEINRKVLNMLEMI